MPGKIETGQASHRGSYAATRQQNGRHLADGVEQVRPAGGIEDLALGFSDYRRPPARRVQVRGGITELARRVNVIFIS
jgi:hypothetical protein